MSKKTLLNENTIRRFMKLAEIEALTNPFFETTEPIDEEAEELEEMGGHPSYLDDEGGEEELDVDVAGLEADVGGEEDLESEEDLAGLEDLEGEEDLEGLDLGGEEDLGGGDAMEELTQDLATAIGDFLRDKMEDGTLEITTGEDAEEIDLGAEEGEEGLEGLEDEEAFGAGMEVGAEEEVEAELEEAHEDVDEGTHKGGRRKTARRAYEKQEESLVAEVARRVAKRILTAKKR